MKKLKTKYDREKEEQVKVLRVAESALSRLAMGEYPTRGRIYDVVALKALLALRNR